MSKKPLDCKIDADYCGDVLCQHLKEPCDWWLQRMPRDEYKRRQDEHYKEASSSEISISAYWYGEENEMPEKNDAAIICPNCGMEMVKARFEIEGGWISAWLCECEEEEGEPETSN